MTASILTAAPFTADDAPVYAVQYRLRSDVVDLLRPTAGQVPTWTVLVKGSHADVARCINQGRDGLNRRMRAVTIRLVDGSAADWDSQMHRDVMSGHVVPWVGCCGRRSC